MATVPFRTTAERKYTPQLALNEGKDTREVACLREPITSNQRAVAQSRIGGHMHARATSKIDAGSSRIRFELQPPLTKLKLDRRCVFVPGI